MQASSYSLSLFFYCFIFFSSSVFSRFSQNSYKYHHFPTFFSMASLQASPPLKGLVVFRNRIHKELIRSIHVYQLEGGAEEMVEREYLFLENLEYEEMKFLGKVFTLQKFDVSAHFAGMANGVWDCIYVFNMDLDKQPNLEMIPEDLSITRNPKLASIPSLSNDLEVIFKLGHKIEYGDPSQVLPKEGEEFHSDVGHLTQRAQHVPVLDLNSLPCSESENEENNQNAADVILEEHKSRVLRRLLLARFQDESELNFVLNHRWKIAGVAEKKQKRAATRDIARLALEDLAKYFDLPIIEASKNLKVGLTVLKKKCREFGIPRWPHRKIKSLDSLIQDLQGEVKRQLEEDETAAMAVAKRQRMIESEKESIEKKPFLDIQWETKKFRQDIFKRRHRARALDSQSRTLSLL